MPSARRPDSGRTIRISGDGGPEPPPRRRPQQEIEPVTGTYRIPRAEEPVTGTHTIPRGEGDPQRVSQHAPDQRRRRQRRERRNEPREPSRSSDLTGRVLVAVPAVVLAVAFADLGGIGWTLLMALLGLACASELYHMLDEWKPVQLAGFVVIVGMALAADYGGQKYVAGVAAAVLPLSFLGVLYRRDVSRSTLAVASTAIAVLWIGFAFATGVLLRDAAHGKGLVIDVMVGTFVGDIAAYFGGRWFGRHPLAPAVSPNKTIEGLFCGAIGAILAVFCAGLYQNWLPHGTALLIGLAIAVLGPIGDLFESAIKRDTGVKDAGTMFGAHGGALDRLDAVSFTIFAVYYIWILVPH
jgi:phosphatidate cytidylyltransferase